MGRVGNSGVKIIKAVIGATRDWRAENGQANPYRIEFDMAIMPPSVNHYVKHLANGKHVKTAEAKAFEDDFGVLAPRHWYVTSATKKFSVSLQFWPGPNGRGDIDNYNKMPLDCCAKAGMFRDLKGKECSDAKIKRLHVEIHDEPEDRAAGPKMRITIEAL